MESGVSWIPALMARLDAAYMARSYEAPLLRRLPSDYMREMFYCTQPLERVADTDLLAAMFRAINAETQLVWGSNYPNSDFDLPSTIFDLPFLTHEAKKRIFGRKCGRSLCAIVIGENDERRDRAAERTLLSTAGREPKMTAHAIILNDKPDIVSLGDRASLERSTASLPPREVSVSSLPAGNRMSERQFGHFAPKELGVHAARVQMNGKYHKPFPQLLDAIASAARTLADARVDLIAFHCTATAMEYGPDGAERRIRDVIAEATGTPAVFNGPSSRRGIFRIRRQKARLDHALSADLSTITNVAILKPADSKSSTTLLSANWSPRASLLFDFSQRAGSKSHGPTPETTPMPIF